MQNFGSFSLFEIDAQANARVTESPPRHHTRACDTQDIHTCNTLSVGESIGRRRRLPSGRCSSLIGRFKLKRVPTIFLQVIASQ
jgi:hypothetical protein